CGADVVEAGVAERSLDLLRVVLVHEPQQEADQRVGGEVRFHGIDRFLSTLVVRYLSIVGKGAEMTTPPAVYGQFGFTLGLAERTLTAALRRHLAERGVQPETWYALRLLAAQGPGLPREGLTEQLESSRTMTPDSTRELLARLEADGLIRGEGRID